MTISAFQLAYLPFGDERARLDWLRVHGDLHKQLTTAAVQQGNVTIGTYDVYDLADLNDWLYFHNSEHGDIADFFGTPAPPDLSYWDFEDEINFNNWLYSHALTHDDAAKAISP